MDRTLSRVGGFLRALAQEPAEDTGHVAVDLRKRAERAERMADTTTALLRQTVDTVVKQDERIREQAEYIRQLRAAIYVQDDPRPGDFFPPPGL